MRPSACLPLVLLAALSPGRLARACAGPDEPALPALTTAALRTAALEPARVRSLVRRARVAGVLPQVIARVGRGSYDSVRAADTLDPTLSSSDSFRWDVTLRLSLDRLVFDVHELRAVEAAGRLVEHRYALLERVAALWAERRALGPDAPDRCLELTALLDALTGGALSAADGNRTNSLPRAPPRR